MERAISSRIAPSSAGRGSGSARATRAQTTSATTPLLWRERTGKGAGRVSVAAGKKGVVDGPLAAAREVCGGYYLIDCASKEEAVEWAARCPAAEHGIVEVREIMPMSMETK